MARSVALIEALDRATAIARDLLHDTVGPVHLLKAILVPEDALAVRTVRLAGINLNEVHARLDHYLAEQPRAPDSRVPPAGSGELKAALQLADIQRQAAGDDDVDDYHVLLVLSGQDGGVPSALRRELGFQRGPLLEARARLARTDRLVSNAGLTTEGPTQAGKPLEFCEDLTARAERGGLDPFTAREAELAQLVEILLRRRKNNPLVLGEPGVGKTALIEGLAQKIVSGSVPSALSGLRIFALDLPSMVAGAKYKGEFEERFKKLLSALGGRVKPAAVLFVDDIHDLVSVGGGSGGLDAASMLKPALARGELQVIGTSTPAAFRSRLEKDNALMARFAVLTLNEPDDAVTREILNSLAALYAQHHGMEIPSTSLDAAARLARRYLTGRALPAKAVDLIDEAAADVAILAEAARRVADAEESGKEACDEVLRDALLARRILQPGERLDPAMLATLARGVVDEEAVARRVALKTGIPIQRMTQSERERLLHLEEHLHRRVIGQDEAISAVANAIRRSRLGIKQRRGQPVGVFLFLGPTGTGKTELAKALAELLFDDERAMVRIDMTEYGQAHNVSRLFGPPPGYEGHEHGGTLTEALKRQPYSLVLFDEVDKAHPRVFDPLMPMFDDGRITDGKGDTVDCSHAVFIMTSNFEGSWIAAQCREHGKVDRVALLRRLVASDSGRDEPHGLRIEFFNRLDGAPVFQPLSEADIERIAEIQLQRLVETVAEQGVTLRLSSEAKTLLARQGYDPELGARPLRRVLDREISDPLALALAAVEESKGYHANVEVRNGSVVVEVVPRGDRSSEPE